MLFYQIYRVTPSIARKVSVASNTAAQTALLLEPNDQSDPRRFDVSGNGDAGTSDKPLKEIHSYDLCVSKESYVYVCRYLFEKQFLEGYQALVELGCLGHQVTMQI